MKRITVCLMLCAGAAGALDTTAARAAYQQQQVLSEVPRLVQQFEVLAGNQDAIVERLQNLEKSSNAATVEQMRAEIAALRAEIADIRAAVRRDQDAMRAAIVGDLTKRISAMTPPPPPPPAPAPRAAAPSAGRAPAPKPAPYSGPYYEHKVEKGQTLSFIAKGFDTTVAKILAANPGLTPNNVRIGQTIIVPASPEEAQKAAPPPPKKPAPPPAKKKGR